MTSQQHFQALQERLNFIRQRKATNTNPWFNIEIYADERITLRQLKQLTLQEIVKHLN